MRISRPWTILATTAVLLSLQLSCPVPAHADTYQLVALNNDSGLSFYGMDNAGHVVFTVNNGGSQCPPSSATCYRESGSSAYTTALPSLNWDYSSATCLSWLSSCSLTDNGYTATISKDPLGEQDLSVSSGSNPAQLLLTTGFGGIFAINGAGDIVFDNGIYDEWYEAVDLSPTPTPAPEPSTLLLIATGILAPIVFLRRRRTTRTEVPSL